MKILIILMSFYVASAQAVNLWCSNNGEYRKGPYSVLGLKGRGNYLCVNAPLEGIDLETRSGLKFDQGKFVLKLKGVGLGIENNLIAAFTLICPTINHRALGVEEYTKRNGRIKSGVTELYGVRADAAVVLGAGAAMFVDQRGNPCFMGELKAGALGLSVSGLKMQIRRVSEWYDG